jgi:4-hydroxybenzoate polyprenyltransferase
VSRWRDVVRIHRLEYPFPVNYLCHAVLGACYAANDVQQLFTAPVLLSIIANLLSIVGGNPLNAAVDVSTDAHTQGKRDIADAALRVGRNHAMSWTATEMLPSLVSYSAVRPDLTASVWLIFIGLGTLITGRAIWWTVPDRIGDKETAMATPAVRYGAFQAIVIACIVTVAGLGLLGWGLCWRHGPLWALLGVAVSGAFLVSKLALLCRLSDYSLPNSTRLRRRDLSSVMITDVILVLLPLAARET